MILLSLTEFVSQNETRHLNLMLFQIPVNVLCVYILNVHKNFMVLNIKRINVLNIRLKIKNFVRAFRHYQLEIMSIKQFVCRFKAKIKFLYMFLMIMLFNQRRQLKFGIYLTSNELNKHFKYSSFFMFYVTLFQN